MNASLHIGGLLQELVDLVAVGHVAVRLFHAQQPERVHQPFALHHWASDK